VAETVGIPIYISQQPPNISQITSRAKWVLEIKVALAQIRNHYIVYGALVHSNDLFPANLHPVKFFVSI
jgi:hypothetical protein